MRTRSADTCTWPSACAGFQISDLELGAGAGAVALTKALHENIHVALLSLNLLGL
jgi:hypothetical protein